jgi:glutathione reductase (NADPH)
MARKQTVMQKSFDIVIIGGGNAGFGVSKVAQAAGKSLAFIEERDFGGTCPNRGCTPKKVLVAAAHALQQIELAKAHGINVGPATLDWGQLIQRKNAIISHIPAAMRSVADKRGTVFQGHARFIGPQTVQVGDDILHGSDIVIATGSRTRPLDIPGAALMITSDEVLSDPELPREVVFIGGGVIAMEFSHVYARAGSKVTILELAPKLLGRLDADAVAMIAAETERLGVTIKTGVKVMAIERSGDHLQVQFEHDGRAQTVQATRVVNGAGRIANVDGLDLGVANIAHDGIRIAVDAHLRSVSNPAIWVAGDAVAHTAQLSPIATYEGQIVGHNIVHGPTKTPDYRVLPSAVYTVPALASVGLTQQEALDQGLDVTVTTSDMRGWFSAKSYAETVAWAKVLVDKTTDQIVGAHLVGHQGEELVQIFAMAMTHRITASQLRDSPTAYPTFSSDLRNLF